MKKGIMYKIALPVALFLLTNLISIEKAFTRNVNCSGITPTIIGTDGDDDMLGTEGDDVIAGLDGKDVIDGLGGDDTICGGDGRDTILGGPGNDLIIGGEQNDMIGGGEGDDTLKGGDGNDILEGNGGNDVLEGGDGSDDLFGGDGGDIIFGGSNNDKLDGGSGVDDLDGNEGNKDECFNGEIINNCDFDNAFPIANAGPDQSVFTTENVLLDGSNSSDQDEDTLNFNWSFVLKPTSSLAELSDPTVVNPSFTVDVFGDYILGLTVNDGLVDSFPDQVHITTLNSAPVANAGPDQGITVPDRVQLDGSASSDVDGNTITFLWTIITKPEESTAELNDSTIVNPTFNADIVGTYVVQIVVNDGELDSSPDFVVISTDNIRPVADAGDDIPAQIGDAVQLDGSDSSDDDDDTLTYSWVFINKPEGSTTQLLDAGTVYPSFMLDVPGDYIVQLIVNDGTADSFPDTVLVSTNNTRPVANAGDDQAVSPNTIVLLNGSESGDADGHSIAYSWALISIPSGSSAQLNNPDIVNPTFTVDKPGLYIAQLIVTDGLLNSEPDTVVITRENNAPVLDAVGNKSVALGSTLIIELTGSDPDGDEITFSANPLPIPDGAGFDSNTGFFNFTPVPDQAGDIIITFTISDGSLKDSESIIITVTGATGNTTITGKVLDANDAANGITTPIVGANVSLLGSASSVNTDSNGDFTLANLPGGNQILDVDASTANPAPDGNQYASFREAIELIDGAVNNIERPIYLPRIDPDSITTVDPNNTTVVKNPNLEVSLTITPGTALDPDGSLFDGDMSISLVPEGFAPAPLPVTLEPGLLVTIQPVGISFSTPAPITFPNIDRLSPGSEVDIWSLDPDTGEFIIVGIGQVSADGSVIETISGGIIGTDWHAAMPPKPDGTPDPDPICISCILGLGSEANISNGNFREDHTLVSYGSLNQSRALRFVYNSQFVDPRPIIGLDSTISFRAAIPNTASISLSVAGIDQGVETHTDTSGFNPTIDEDFRQAVQFDANGFETGIYPYRIKLTSNYNRSKVSTFINGTIEVNNQSDSSYGAGWTLDGVAKLDIQDNGNVLLVEGDGTLWEFTQPTIDFDLNNWTQEGISTFGNWVLSSTGLSVLQTINGNATFFVSPDDIINTTITGILSVETTTDDDLIGFVFGYKSPIATNGDISNNYEFLLFDWKQNTQNNSAGFTAQEGYALSKVNGIISNNNPGFWGHQDSAEFDVLATSHSSTKGWKDNFTHNYELIYETDRIRISIDGNQIFDVSGSFEPGRFGFYNLSQQSVRYTANASTTNSPIFVTPLGDYSTLLKNLDGSFTRILKNGTKINFDQNGFQTSVVDRNGNTTTYGYDTNYNLISITDPVGMVTNLEYTNGRLSKVSDPAGRETLFDHDSNGNLIKITDPDGTFRQFSYDGDHKLVSKTSKRGFATTYTYNFAGRFTQSVRPDGSIWSLEPKMMVGLADTANGEGTSSNPAPATREEDTVSAFTDGNGNTSFYKSNEFGAVTEFTDSLGRTTITVRDLNNNIIQQIDPRGNIIDHTYDNNGNLLQSIHQSIGSVTNFSYTQDGFNKVKSITDPTNNTMTINYDNNGNQIEAIDSLNNKTAYSYNNFGLILSITDPLDNVISFAYDDITRNKIRVIDQLGNETINGLDSAGNIISVIDRLGRITSFEYDSMNRMLKVIEPDLAQTNYEYDMQGNLIAIIDAKGNTNSFSYDNLNRIISRTDALGNGESLSYDLNGNLVSRTHRNGTTIGYEYNKMDLLTRKILPDNEFHTFAYDDSNNLIEVSGTDSKITMTYDGGNRMTTVSTNGSPSQPTVDITYSYDPAGYLLTSTDNVKGTRSYTYDANKHLESVTNTSNLTNYFIYDAASRQTMQVNPNGTSTVYQYNARGDLTKVDNLYNNNILSSFQYTYDNNGNRIALDQIRSGITLNNHIDYEYDNLDRLIAATHPIPGNPDESFSYDPVGNRLTQTGQITPSVFNANNQLIEDEEFKYYYDLNGNLILKTNKNTQGISTYLYDAENRLIRINIDGVQSVYKYDGFGRRIQKIVDGEVTKYVYDKMTIVNSNFLYEFDDQDALKSSYTYGILDDPLILESDNQTFYYYSNSNNIGDLTELVDSTMLLSNNYAYKAFGDIASEDEVVSNSYRFRGREYDSESGLIYNRARYYDPQIGRFIQEDPIGFGGDGVNLYAYTRNNPVNLIDPSGNLSIPFHGRFCGPGFGDLNNPLVVPVDNLDICCKDHDGCVGGCCRGQHSIPCTLLLKTRNCDKIMCNCVKKTVKITYSLYFKLVIVDMIICRGDLLQGAISPLGFPNPQFEPLRR